jgi:hypothetical protein
MWFHPHSVTTLFARIRFHKIFEGFVATQLCEVQAYQIKYSKEFYDHALAYALSGPRTMYPLTRTVQS